jgi:hypothetical protein
VASYYHPHRSHHTSVDPAAREVLRRFGAFADQFGECFSHHPRSGVATQSLEAFFGCTEGDSAEAGDASLGHAVGHELLQRVMANPPWDASRVWEWLRALAPIRSGVLMIDDAGFSGHAVPRSPADPVVVSTVLYGERVAWPIGLDLYLPDECCTGQACQEVDRSPHARRREKWRIGQAHIGHARNNGLLLTAVLADADYGSSDAFRRMLERRRLRYAAAIRPDLAMRTSQERCIRTAAEIADAVPERQWEMLWNKGTEGPSPSRFAALRVRPNQARGDRWLLCKRPMVGGATTCYLLNLHPAASLRDLADMAWNRWPVERQTRELRDELRFDQLGGRRAGSWPHHAITTAVAFAFLQLERARSLRGVLPPLREVRLWVQRAMAVFHLFGLLESVDPSQDVPASQPSFSRCQPKTT